jgi:hypothetical protein
MSSPAPLSSPAFLQELFEAIPTMLLVVDEGIRIHGLNSQAAQGLHLDPLDGRTPRIGVALPCVHAPPGEDGCGRGPLCGDCTLRDAVSQALGGHPVQRRSTRMTLCAGGKLRNVHLLLSATPFSWAGKLYVLLVVEDHRDLQRMFELLPICPSCQKIQGETGTWHAPVDFGPSLPAVDAKRALCPGCRGKA